MGIVSNASGDAYAPAAIYHVDSDCVEYVRNDGLLLYERIDPFLTLVFDNTGENLGRFQAQGLSKPSVAGSGTPPYRQSVHCTHQRA